MKISIPKEFKYTPTLGEQLEDLSFEACADWIGLAMDYVSEILKTSAAQGFYAVSIYHKDIQRECNVPDANIQDVIVHLENWIINQGIQIVEFKDGGGMLSLVWGVGKFPEGFTSMSIMGVRG